ncbi:MAG: primosomal protein N' [Pseudomonadota bacterium]
MPILRLAVPSPLRRSFDYLPPPDLNDIALAQLQPGVRIEAPFGSRRVIGYLIELVDDSDLPADSLKAAIRVLDETPLISDRLLQLARWSAAYYHHPLGEVLCALFPKRLREGLEHQPLGDPGWQLSTRGKGLPDNPLPRSPRQAQAIKVLAEMGATSATSLAQAGISAQIMRALRDKGLVESTVIKRSRPPVARATGLSLTGEQTEVLHAIHQSSQGFACHLLDGITGSGKTEVYLQLIDECLAREQQALVLIPEIGLTPQTLQRFQQRFGIDIAVLHSGLGEAERYRAWEAARTGSTAIVIGTRSAVFTPLSRPGLIIVDEEHDASYKQQDGFRYWARDVAVKRAQLHDCPVVLGSATPSLESLYNALQGRYQHHRLTQRAGDSALPAVDIIDLRRQSLRAGLSNDLIDAVAQCLDKGEQCLLFLNRRGYAPSLQCHDCGWVAQCASCDARMTVHRRQQRLRCHHCGAERPLPNDCESCHSHNIAPIGLGTEQTEQCLHQLFPQWPTYRVDSDSMQGRHAMQELVDTINRGAPCILLGTQMLTKGHHFPRVSLVAVIDADALLFSADFRGEERMAQLLTQVAGRAGREDIPGRVLVQTHYPDHPALHCVLDANYAHLAKRMLAQRQASGLPPSGVLIIVRSDCADGAWGEQFLQRLRTDCEPSLGRGCQLVGPLPAPMQRRAGRYRSQLLLTAPNRASAHNAATQMVSAAEALPSRKQLKWTIDIDPLDVS